MRAIFRLPDLKFSKLIFHSLRNLCFEINCFLQELSNFLLWNSEIFISLCCWGVCKKVMFHFGSVKVFFCNRRNSFLSFGEPQLYNLEALPFTYDQYFIIELADKLYNSDTVCFLCDSMNIHPDKQLFKIAGSGDQTTDPCITKPGLYVYTIGDPPVKVII